MRVSRLIPVASITMLIVLGIAIYANSLTGAFIWDDNSLIVDNSAIKSWSNLADIFTKGNISTYTGKTFHIYRPIQMVSYMADYAAWELNPVGYHVTNIVLHISAAILLYLLIMAISADKFISFVTSACFLVHPIHTEAVTYISGRADPISAVFAVICILLYVRYAGARGVWHYLPIFLSYLLAILSRENILILPALLLAYNFSFRKKIDWRLLAPLTAIGVMYIVVRFTFLKHLLPSFSAAHKTTFFDRLPGFFAAVTEYVRLLIWPQDLHMEYGDKVFNFSYAPAIIGIGIVALLVFNAFKARKTNGIMTFALLWFFIALLPMSNLYPVGAYMAEHWIYFASIGFFLAAAVFLRSLCYSRFIKIAVASIVVIMLGKYSYATIIQNNCWKDPVDFYERTLRFAPDSMRASNDLAIAYEKEGMHEKSVEIYDRMMQQYPGHPDVYVNLAAVQIIKGNIDDAIELCCKAITVEPNNATAHNNLAVAYYVQGKYELAIQHCDLAIKYGYKVKPELIRLLAPHRS